MPATGTFQCSKCQAKFAPPDGGLCSACGRLFCRAHLNIIKNDRDIVPICVDCSHERKDEEGFTKLIEEKDRH